MMHGKALSLGLVFGFVLSRGRATDYDAILGMFLLRDFHLPLLMGAAIGVTALGTWLIRRSRARALGGGLIDVTPKPMHAGVWLGGLVFGFGWGLTGTCPGTGIAQLGEGKLLAAFTLAGMLAGTLLFGRLEGALARWLEGRAAIDPGR